MDKDGAMKMALEALEQQIKSIEQMPIARREKGISVFAVPEAAWVGLTSCAYALRQAIEQAQKQEPVKIMGFNCFCGRRMEVSAEQGVVPASQRQWVGLNWDDLPEIYVGDVAFTHGVKWAEARLKEKNGIKGEAT